MRNKANLHPQRRIGGASPTLQGGTIAPNEPNSARPGGRPGVPGGNVRNKANFRTDRKEREPVPPIGAIMQNKANAAQAAERASTWWKTSYGELNMQQTSAKQSQSAPDRPEEALGEDQKCGRWRGQACKTKPISSRRTGTAGRWAGPRTLPPVGASCTKQSQFAPDRRGEVPATGASRVAATGGKCAKQSQFASPRCAPVAVAWEHERRVQVVCGHQGDSGLRRI